MTWPIAFLLTQVIEIAIALAIWKDAPRRKVIFLVFLASAITHPIVWFILPDLAREHQWNYITYVAVAEGYAYGVEILWYMAMKVPRPVVISCAANTGSFGAGLLVHTFLL